MQANYDQTDPLSIERYGKALVGKTLRRALKEDVFSEAELNTVQSGATRGSFGTILETRYFNIHPGNSSAPDFVEAGVELKSLPIKKRSKGGHQAKERLVLNIINYKEEAEKNFNESSFLTKAQRMVLIGYLYEKGINVVDFYIKIAKLLEYKNLPEDERLMIRSDWNKISEKIKSGRAHELSEGDTLLLGACTKAASSKNRTSQANGGPLAKPRAFSLKQGYVTRLIRRELGESDLDEEKALKGDDVKKADSFERLIGKRFESFVGKTISEIHAQVGDGLNVKSKDYLAALSRRMMGIRKGKVAEFEDAGVAMKTIQLKASGVPKEHMSFPAFKFAELIEEKWDGDEDLGEKRSSFQKQIERRFFLVVFQCGGDCKGNDQKKLKKVMFWTMPAKDMDEAERVWEETVKRVRALETKLPGSKESDVAHVRPHARDGMDYDEMGDGVFAVKKGFWLNAEYIKNQIQ